MNPKTVALRIRLKSLRRVNATYRWYIPRNSLQGLMDEDTVQGALRENGIRSYQLAEVTKNIIPRGRRIFAILLLIDLIAEVCNFIEAGELNDERLPLNIEVLRRVLPTTPADDFFEKQWELSAPIFQYGTINQTYLVMTVIPIVCEKQIGTGGFSTVYEIELDPEHQFLGGSFQKRLVRKEVHSLHLHKIELENLAILAHLKHPNILELLASYTHNDRYSLIFPLAEGGTLKDVFNKNRLETEFSSDDACFIALSRLSSAIQHVHDFSEQRIDLFLLGCHHDLQPKNILISGSALILGDFGLSKFKTLAEGSESMFRQGAGDYLAPECEDLNDIDFRKLMIRRSSDIWSFGCIIVEFATYMMLDPAGVQDFKDKRSFEKQGWKFSLFHHGPNETSPAVQEWILGLHDRASSSMRMLLRLAEDMLSMKEQKRPRAQSVTARLRSISHFHRVELVERLLASISPKRDVLIERLRFQSWAYSVGVNSSGSMLDTSGVIIWEQTHQFEAMMDCLSSFRAFLDSISTQDNQSAPMHSEQINRFNNSLSSFLDKSQQQTFRTHFRASLLESGHQMLSNIGENLPETIDIDRTIRMRILLKQMTELMLDRRKTQGEDYEIDASEVSVGSRIGTHNLGQLGEPSLSNQVLIEWRSYEHRATEEAVSHELLIQVEALVDLLSQDKPEDFRALDSKGFFHDEGRLSFGVIYEVPTTLRMDHSRLSISNLQSLILETSNSLKLYPALDDRFKLAHTLAQSVLDFHSVGWLHKRLSSANIAFFPTTNKIQDDWFRSPYIIGFSHSRPDEESAPSWGPDEQHADRYQHPEYLQRGHRYCAEYDYYSLGIVLMEIGCWQTLSQITQKYSGSHRDIQRRLLQDRIPWLSQSMGRYYTEAVRRCVASDFDLSEREAAGKGDSLTLHMSFERLVVRQLTRII
ncbi:kinase-like protein [Amniculicola lignicola CBS 123094]|uniref:Kinase-like protein n=1 Tax=Amniculicola lignicola CBS 123094 TaxID=1392246 RepID=A0A6A5VTX9_9PLEO|nr:kinase-like protein [Amniculicola lignicola CBS 123094]